MVADRADLHIEQGGGAEDAPNLLFLHGFGADRLSWAATAPAFADSHRVWLADLPGHGRSAGHSACAIEDMADAVGEAMRVITSGPVCVVGHSLGGAVALALARRAPGLVERLVLIAPAGLGRALDRTFLEGFAEIEDVDAAMELLRRLVVRPRLVSAAMAEHVLRSLGVEGAREGLRRIAEKTMEAGRPDGLELPDGAVIWGEEDSINPPDKAYLDQLGWPVHIIACAGHLPHIEAITKTNTIIAAALRQPGETAAGTTS